MSAATGYSHAHDARRKRLLLRVHSTKQLHHASSSLGVYCKLYLGDTPMVNGSQRSLFSKRSSSDEYPPARGSMSRSTFDESSSAPSSNSSSDGGAAVIDSSPHGAHRIFRTGAVLHDASNPDEPVVWDQNFDVLVLDPTKEILSVRVKSRHRLYPAVLGVLAIKLKQLKVGHAVDQWFPLTKGDKEVARLRLQLVLAPLDPHESHPDEAIDRLLIAAAQWKKPDDCTPPAIRRDSSGGDDAVHKPLYVKKAKTNETRSKESEAEENEDKDDYELDDNEELYRHATGFVGGATVGGGIALPYQSADTDEIYNGAYQQFLIHFNTIHPQLIRMWLT
ncbi:hypothetical protein P43SY_000502 [Pythium insidiosum]|uniref:C2 domain-containing protein n=1 Tax=Pythium insidiosum TaxID=114742 RepID=A0AAD5M5G0_PYTIN|nr:hypothetical protein P43SY_000502 [Pythium insidiosum]